MMEDNKPVSVEGRRTLTMDVTTHTQQLSLSVEELKNALRHYLSQQFRTLGDIREVSVTFEDSDRQILGDVDYVTITCVDYDDPRWKKR